MMNPMATEHKAPEISDAARQLLAGGDFGGEPLRRSATVERALPVLATGGVLHSWFVPVTVGDRLAAFFQFLPDGTLMRFSSFQRRPDKFDDCPASAGWLDRDRIQERVAAQKRSDETIGEPFLTFDRVPDRLVWAVPLAKKNGEARLLYVAGASVYAPPPEGTIG